MSLDDLTTDDGRFHVLAIDHRDALRVFLSPEDPDGIPADRITALKAEIVAGVADLASGVMLEPEYSIPQLLDAGVIPEGVGFMAALESQGYLADPGASPTRVLDGWSVEQAHACGAAAAKVLLPYHPDRPLAAAQEDVARGLLDACQALDLPLLMEPLFYDLDSPDDRPRVVVETARRFAAIGPQILKLPYPGTAAACSEISELASMPWTMLSGGGSFEAFADDLAVAMANGCSGFTVGRALWGDAAVASDDDRPAILRDLIRPRFEQLVTIASP